MNIITTVKHIKNDNSHLFKKGNLVESKDTGNIYRVISEDGDRPDAFTGVTELEKGHEKGIGNYSKSLTKSSMKQFIGQLIIEATE